MHAIGAVFFMMYLLTLEDWVDLRDGKVRGCKRASREEKIYGFALVCMSLVLQGCS